jgi:hypothetical protein
VVPGGPTAASAAQDLGADYATLCWGSCRGGLTFLVPLHWSATHAGAFRTSFTVPATPWLTVYGPHALVPGTYPVGLQCLPPVINGCALRGAEVRSLFTLRGSADTACQPGHPCAWLRLRPDAAAPGATVAVQGWAPLTPVVGQPMGYTLSLEGLPPAPGGGGTAVVLGQVVQSANGDLFGSVRLPTGVYGVGPLPPGRYVVALRYTFLGAAGLGPSLPKAQQQAAVASATVQLAPTPFRVTPAPGWAALGRLRPVVLTRNSALAAQDPADPALQAYCDPQGGIRISADGGARWFAVTTRGVATTLRGSGYTLLPARPAGAEPTCTALALDPAHADHLFAVFPGALRKYGAPPLFRLALWTADGGRSWHLVPPPAGFTPGDFGGFVTQGDAVFALFAGTGTSRQATPPWSVERAVGGGQRWQAASLPCPVAGPCLRWGPAPNALGPCAMNGAPQTLLVSSDGGRRWRAVAGVAPNACNLVELVATGGRDAVLVSGSSFTGAVLRQSRDGGLQWQVVQLPPFPGEATQAPAHFAGLQLLPDGALWATDLLPQGRGFVQRMLLLAPGAHRWCVAGPALGADAPADEAQVLDGQLWVFSPEGVGGPALLRVPLARLHCAAAG